MARRGAGGLNEPLPEPFDDRRSDRRSGRDDKDAKRGAESETPDGSGKPLPPKPERNLPDGDDLRRSADKAVKRSRRRTVRDRKPLPARPVAVLAPEVSLRRMVDDQRARRLARRLKEAGKAFESERFDECRKVLVPFVREVPTLAESRELLGLSMYRMGRWKEAITQLEAFRELSGSTEQHPVLADCHRAVGHWADVEELWTELGEVSPSSALMNEGRIVLAGARADQGDVPGAIRVLEDGWRLPKKPRPHHLRRAYALADLYERVGRNPRARQLFTWIANHDPDLADVTARVRSLN